LFVSRRVIGRLPGRPELPTEAAICIIPTGGGVCKGGVQSKVQTRGSLWNLRLSACICGCRAVVSSARGLSAFLCGLCVLCGGEAVESRNSKDPLAPFQGAGRGGNLLPRALPWAELLAPFRRERGYRRIGQGFSPGVWRESMSGPSPFQRASGTGLEPSCRETRAEAGAGKPAEAG